MPAPLLINPSTCQLMSPLTCHLGLTESDLTIAGSWPWSILKAAGLIQCVLSILNPLLLGLTTATPASVALWLTVWETSDLVRQYLTGIYLNDTIMNQLLFSVQSGMSQLLVCSQCPVWLVWAGSQGRNVYLCCRICSCWEFQEGRSPCLLWKLTAPVCGRRECLASVLEDVLILQ